MAAHRNPLWNKVFSARQRLAARADWAELALVSIEVDSPPLGRRGRGFCRTRVGTRTAASTSAASTSAPGGGTARAGDSGTPKCWLSPQTRTLCGPRGSCNRRGLIRAFTAARLVALPSMALLASRDTKAAQ